MEQLPASSTVKSPRKTKGFYYPRLLSEMIAEGTGTFALVFAGTGAIMVNGISEGRISNLGISIAICNNNFEDLT